MIELERHQQSPTDNVNRKSREWVKTQRAILCVATAPLEAASFSHWVRNKFVQLVVLRISNRDLNGQGHAIYALDDYAGFTPASCLGALAKTRSSPCLAHLIYGLRCSTDGQLFVTQVWWSWFLTSSPPRPKTQPTPKSRISSSFASAVLRDHLDWLALLQAFSCGIVHRYIRFKRWDTSKAT